MRRLAGPLSGLGVALLGVGLALALVEGVARLGLPPPYSPTTGHFFECDPALGWTGAANFQGVLEWPGFEQPVRFNRLGMHDTDHPRQKPAETFRVLMLGDSFVHAVQVSEGQTAHQHLENLLNEQGGQSFEVLSAGVVNWGTNQQLEYYRRVGRDFQPDLVLLVFYVGNDFLDNLPGNGLTVQGYNCYAPYFALCDGQLNPDALRYAPGLSRIEGNCGPLRRGLIEGAGRLYQHSELYRQLEPLLVEHRPRQTFGGEYASPFSALYVEPEAAELAQARAVTLATLEQLRREVAADGSRLAVALVSPAVVVRLGALSPAEQAVFLRDNPAFATARLERPTALLAEFLQAQGVPYRDLTGPMAAQLRANPQQPLYILGEGHWTPAGNRLAAELLLPLVLGYD